MTFSDSIKFEASNGHHYDIEVEGETYIEDGFINNELENVEIYDTTLNLELVEKDNEKIYNEIITYLQFRRYDTIEVENCYE